MSDNPYKRTAAVRYINAAAYMAIGIALIGGFLVAVGIEKDGLFPQVIAAMLMGWGGLAILVVRIVDYAGRSAHASEEAAKSARESADLLRQLVRSQDNSPEA